MDIWTSCTPNSPEHPPRVGEFARAAGLREPEMETYLRPGVHMCLVDEGAVFLDLAANVYLGIDAATKDALSTCLVGLTATPRERASDIDSGLPAGLAPLVKRGLLTDSASLGRSYSFLAVPMIDALPFGTERTELRIGVNHLVRFVRALLRASIMIRRGHLLALISHLATLKARPSSTSRIADFQNLVTLVHIVRRLSTIFYTSKNACLLDSLVLAEFLIRYGHAPTLVLGVRTKPFLAHAWVQMGTCVLNDTIEHAQTLTPIAAI